MKTKSKKKHNTTNGRRFETDTMDHQEMLQLVRGAIGGWVCRRRIDLRGLDHDEVYTMDGKRGKAKMIVAVVAITIDSDDAEKALGQLRRRENGWAGTHKLDDPTI